MDIRRLDEHSHSCTLLEGVVVLNHHLEALVRFDKHLVVNTLKGAGFYRTGKVGILHISNDVDILWSYHDINCRILAKSAIHTLELMADKLDLLVLYHRAVQDVTLADKVCNKRVCRLVVDIDRSANLLNFTLTHNYDCIAQSESLLLVVRYIYKGDTECFVHLLQLHLHILAHLQVERSQRLVEQKHLRLIYDGTSDGYTLLLTSRQRIYIAVLVVGH